MTALSRSLSPDELAVRLHQQELVAAFGLFALSNRALPDVFIEASTIAARGLNVQLAKVLQYRPASNDFLVIAGVGWRPGVVGHATLPAGTESPAGYALKSRAPVITHSLADEKRFRLPALLVEHAVHSTINVPIGPVDEAFGVLEVDSTHRNDFVAADTAFLQSLATALAAAISRVEAEATKDELLREKDLLMQEVHHRVKNSLQVVHTILLLQARTAGSDTRQQLESAAGRIMTIGAVHHRLYAGSSVVRTEASDFLLPLLSDMQALLGQGGAARECRLEASPLQLSADALTPLGIVVAELVTNAVKYARGTITVKLAERAAGLRVTVEDQGPGFPPEFDPKAGGLGMRLVGTLALPDSIEIDRSVPYGSISVELKR